MRAHLHTHTCTQVILLMLAQVAKSNEQSAETAAGGAVQAGGSADDCDPSDHTSRLRDVVTSSLATLAIKACNTPRPKPRASSPWPFSTLAPRREDCSNTETDEATSHERLRSALPGHSRVGSGSARYTATTFATSSYQNASPGIHGLDSPVLGFELEPKLLLVWLTRNHLALFFF